MGFPLSDLLVPSRKDKRKLYGTTPDYDFTPQSTAAEAIAANQENLPALEKLASGVNTFNFEQQSGFLRRAIPGFDTNTKLSSDILTARLRGEFTESELNELQLAAASRGISRGTGGGSGFDKADLARSLGLNRYAETQRALDSNARWNESMARLTQPALFNVGSAFITPQQQFDYRKLLADTEAAPNPGARGAFDSKMGALGMMLGVYGGAGYQSAYQPASQRGGGANTQQYLNPNWTGGASGNYLAESSPGFGSGGIYE